MPPKIMSKPNKSSLDLKCVNSIHKLACQKIKHFHPSQKLSFPESFTVDEDLFHAKQ